MLSGQSYRPIRNADKAESFKEMQAMENLLSERLRQHEFNLSVTALRLHLVKIDIDQMEKELGGTTTGRVFHVPKTNP
ncbi:hypothetical protein LSH36_463g00012 [Paralvinella palmiformis]|uniref:Uncharacterized protein n=1 Tax=Paralvinella palmiformis TaxID=53620 RepID=A0AAD9JAU8_9ANNE|nr:hypothetical protein LSH36_463g00012 [Paralvinella palmiformis]